MRVVGVGAPDSNGDILTGFVENPISDTTGSLILNGHFIVEDGGADRATVGLCQAGGPVVQGGAAKLAGAPHLQRLSAGYRCVGYRGTLLPRDG